MVLLDIPFPDRCESCPCSYWIISGVYKGRLMCEAMEANTTAGTDRTEKCLVNETEKPQDCPMREADPCDRKGKKND